MREAFDQAAALADALRTQFGVGAGTKVAVVMSNRIEWIISVLAITAVGGVAALSTAGAWRRKCCARLRPRSARWRSWMNGARN